MTLIPRIEAGETSRELADEVLTALGGWSLSAWEAKGRSFANRPHPSRRPHHRYPQG